MLRRKNFLHNALKSMLVILFILCFTSIGLAQPWTTKTPMPTARAMLSSSVVDNIIYAIGGGTGVGSNLDAMEAYDPQTDLWTSKSPMPTPRAALSTCEVDGIIYAIGGGWTPVLSALEAYDPQTDTWTTKASMPTPRSGLSVCSVDGIIYAIGGFGDTQNGLSTVEAYDPQTDTWSTKTSMQTARFGSASVVDGIIYVMGGSAAAGTASMNIVEAYNPATDTWTTKSSMLNIRQGLSSESVFGKIYVFGGVGYGGGPCFATMEKYEPATNSWTMMPDMPLEVAYPACSTVDGKIYLFGGFNTARVSLNSVYEYDPSLVIPVELVSFTGNNVDGKVLLEWKTATELNNSGFEVQRKAAECEFTTIGFVKGQGTTTNQKKYSYTDKDLAGGKYFYRLKQIDFDGTFEYSNEIEVEVRILDNFTLEQNYPNPFNPTTTIGYVLQEKSNTKLILLNTIGEEIAVLVNGEQDKGYHKVEFDAANLPSGVYFYKLSAGPSSSSGQAYVETKKMILLR